MDRNFSKQSSPFLKHINSSTAAESVPCLSQAQTGTKHQRLCGSVLSDYNFQIVNSLEQGGTRTAGQLVSFRQQSVQPVLNQTVRVRNKSEPSEKTYNKRTGAGNIKGLLCKIELAMLFLLKGFVERTGGFHLAANMEEAGDFRDVVYKYKYRCRLGKNQIRKEKSKIIFLRSMHVDDVENKKKIDVLSSDAKKKDCLQINLQKLFDSYRTIKKQFEEKKDHPIFESNFEDSRFVLYTNALPDFNDGGNMFEQTGEDFDDILHVERRQSVGHCYKLILLGDNVKKTEQEENTIRETNQKIISTLKGSSECRKLVKELVKTVFHCEEGKNLELSHQGILKKYHIQLSETVIIKSTKGAKSGKFSTPFIKGENGLSAQDSDFRKEFFEEAKKLTGKSETELRKELESKIIKLSDKFGVSDEHGEDSVADSLPSDHVDENEIREFLRKLEFHIGMPDEGELAEIIKDKLEDDFDVNQTDVDAIFSDVKAKVEGWWKGKNFYLTERNRFFFDSIRISISFDVKRPVEMFTGRKQELEKLHNMVFHREGTSETSQVAVITGLGGIGKTELLRQYIYKHSNDYDNNVLWINAENYGALADSFCRLAQNVLKIGIKNSNGTAKDIRCIVDDVYKYFYNRKCLFVFDNAEKYKTQSDTDSGIDKFLPTMSRNNKMFIVVTSQSREWGYMKTLPLDVFTKEDAVAFIRVASVAGNGLQEEIQEFSEILHRFPLVLQQAVAYIKEQNNVHANTGEKFSIGSYLSLFKEEGMKMKELLDFRLTHNNDYSRTTFITLTMSLQKIKTMNHGDEALEILDIMAYFAPDSISTKIFSGRVSDRRALASALQLLKQYSIISIANSEAKVHRLTQQIIREVLKTQLREMEVLMNALTMLKSAMESEDEIKGACTSHAMSTWTHASKHETLIKRFSDVPLDIMLELCEKGIIREEVYLFGRDACQLLERVLGVGDVNTILTMNAIAVVCEHRGKYSEALEFRRDVNNKLLHILDSDDPLALTLQNNFAASLRNQGKYDEAWEVCQEVLDKRRKILGDNHPDTLSSLSDAATILNNQRKYDEAVEAYKEVLEKQEKVLGQYHRDTLSTKQELAIVYYHQRKYDKALEACEEVLEEQTHMLDPDDPHILGTKMNMSLILYAKGQYDEALSSCEELIDKTEQVIGPDNTQSFIVKLCRAAVLYKKGNYSDALTISQELINQKEGLLGPDHPDVLQTHNIRAGALLQLGRYDEALLAYHELLNRESCAFGCNDQRTLQTQLNKATVLAMQAKYNEALHTYKELLAKSEQFGSDYILGIQHDIAGVLVDQGHFYDALETYQDVLKELQNLMAPDHLDILITKENIASVLAELGKYEDALQTYGEVLERRKKTLEPYHPSTLLTRINMTAVLHRQGKYDKALLDYQELLEVSEQVLTPDHPCNLTIRSNMANVLQDKGFYDMALQIHQMILEKRLQILDSDHPDVLISKGSIANVFILQEKYDKALKIFSEVLGKRKIRIGLNHPESLRTLNVIAGLLAALGNYEESLQTFREALDRRKQIFSEDHPEILVTQDRMADVLFRQGKYSESLNSHNTVFDKKKRSLGLLHPSTLDTWNNIGRIFLKQGKYSDAQKIFNEVLDGRKRALGPSHPDTLDVLDDLAEIPHRQGHYDLSLKAYKNALSKRKQFLGPNHPDTLRAEGNIAAVLFSQGHYTDALSIYCEVFDKMVKVFSPNSPSTLDLRNSMATVLLAQGSYDDAVKIYQEILENREKVLGPYHPDTLSTLSDIARVMGAKKDFESSMEAHRDVLHKKTKILGPNHPDTLRTEYDIAEICFEQGNYETAVEVYRKILDKSVQVFGLESPHVLVAQKKVAMSLYAGEHYEEALNAYYDLFNSSEQLLGPDDHDTLSVMDDVTNVLYSQGKYDEALKISQEILGKKEKVLGSRHPSTLFTMERVVSALGDTEEYFAVIKTCVEVLDNEQMLALYNSDPPTAGYMVLHTICREGDERILIHLLENGADVLARNEDHTLVHQAATNKNSEVLNLILSGIKQKCGNVTQHIDSADEEGDTPLMWATETGNVNSARLLLEWGANVNAKNKSGQTALHWAAKGGFKDLVELLLDNKIDPNIKDLNNDTALDLAYKELEHGMRDEEDHKLITCLVSVTQETVQSK